MLPILIVGLTGTVLLLAAIFQTFASILKSLEKRMSQVTDAVAAMETSFGKVSTDLQTLSTNITNLQSQIAAGLSTTDAAALAKVVSDAQALASAADAAANPPMPAPAPAPQPAPAAS